MMEIRIKPTRELFFDEEKHFGIYACEVNPEDTGKVKMNNYGNISVKGVTPRLNMNQEYTAVVNEDTGSKYAGGYNLESIKMKKPETVKEQKSFLSTILTANQIENIYKVYTENDNVVGLIESGEFDYKKVSGLGDKTFEKLQKKVMENIDMSDVLAFCAKFDIKYNLISKLVKEYKNPQIVIQKIKQNPYVLTEVKGIGFKKADVIAKAVGYDLESPHRINSAIKYIVSEEHQNGNSWIDEKNLLNRCIELLSIGKALITSHIRNGASGVMELDGRFTTVRVYEAEQHVAQEITRFKTQSKKLFETEELEKYLDEYCKDNSVEFEENQRKFFHDWNENNILLLIGGGGMGKLFV